MDYTCIRDLMCDDLFELKCVVLLLGPDRKLLFRYNLLLTYISSKHQNIIDI